jgi:hypothetical protein
MFPGLVLENFYTKTRNSIEEGRTKAPHGYAIPLQRDMTRVATLVDILRAQGIEVGRLTADYRAGGDTIPAGSYLIKLDQPYGRLARNLLEKQDYPDAALRTYDDSGWSMGWALNVAVREIKDKAVLDARVTLVDRGERRGRSLGSGTAALAVAHYGSNQMIAFRYRLRRLGMQVAEQAFPVERDSFPAGSFLLTGTPADLAEARAVADSFGLTTAGLAALPAVRTHEADAPRIAIYSQWSGTQELGWYRHAFDRFGIPFELIYKERVARGNLRNDYDVILMAAQNLTRQAVMARPAAQPRTYQKSDKYQFLGMYGESANITGGFGQEGVTAFEEFLAGGGTLIAAAQAVRFPIEFGFARTVDTETPSGVSAQKPLVVAEIKRTDHPVFYGFEGATFPVKYVQGAQVFRVGIADQGNVLAQYQGGDAAVLSGLMTGADNLKGRAFAVDIPNAHLGKGRVIMFTNNPVYRWQNHGEFNLVFNALLNWNDVPAPSRPAPVRAAGANGRPEAER